MVLKDLNPESAARLYHRARLSLAEPAVDFLLEKISRSC